MDVSSPNSLNGISTIFFNLIQLFPIVVIAQSPIKHVNSLIGTAPATTESAKKHGAGTEEKGQTFPATGRPFGMTQWTPETRTTEDK